eukprot:TRINITY_DN6638_c0_g1_i1.p1 TRINITY_DN6638_c0_g1~~TRINITY_DN6638_c0_g1_i1.p1  ORF type:complete len:281 (+),score=38.52 TRINITY_DN6638_c0_g1_i1:43-885(+)
MSENISKPPKFEIHSVAGEGTCIVLPEYKVVFDMGVVHKSSVAMDHVFITHGHMDHICNIPRHASLRELRGKSGATYYVHESNVKPLETIMACFRELNHSKIACNFKGVNFGDSISIGNDKIVRPFKTVHRVPSQGYVIWNQKKKLKPEHYGKSAAEISKLHKQGVQISDVESVPEVAYTGDTTIEVLLVSEIIKTVKTLFIEVSIIDDSVSPEVTRKRGHLHLDDIIQNAHEFKNEYIVFMHFSSRYHADYIQAVVDKKLPDSLKSKVILAINSHRYDT